MISIDHLFETKVLVESGSENVFFLRPKFGHVIFRETSVAE